MDIYIQKTKRKWAVRRKGVNRALKLFTDVESAFEYAVTIKPPILVNWWTIGVLNYYGKLIQRKIKAVPIEAAMPEE